MQNLVRCQIHRQSSYEFLIIEKENVKLACSQCIESSQNFYRIVNFSQIINLRTALAQPDILLCKLGIDLKQKNFIEAFSKVRVEEIQNQYSEWEKSMKNLKQIIDEMIETYQQYIKQLNQNQMNFRLQLGELINHQKFKQLIGELEKQQIDNNFDVHGQIERNIWVYFQDLQKTDCAKLKSDLGKIIENYDLSKINMQPRSIEKLEIASSRIIANYKKQTEELFNKFYPSSSIISLNYFDYLKQTISFKTNKKISKVTQIYLGSKDGLNGQAFWSKVQGKSNLLMVFLSSNSCGTVFGGFSPCTWNSGLQNYVADNALSSFIFSEKHQQIFPLKPENKAQSIYCHPNYGPSFGGGHCIYIHPDFKQGHSNLGYAYYWDKYQGKYSDYLFGGLEPQLQECEIYEFTLE